MSLPRGDRQIRWLVCERTGRSAAALRIAVARDAARRRNDRNIHRIKEFRGLRELSESLPNDHPAIALVEVGEENLADVVEFLSGQHNKHLRFVALKDESLRKSADNTKLIVPDRDFVSNTLFEAGAVDILETPRQISRLLPLAARLAQADSCFSKSPRDYSIAEMAKLALPWQID